MNKKLFNALCVTVFAGSCLLTNQVSATERSAAEKFGPRQPIIMEFPVKVIFDHRVHTDAVGLECNACHDGLFAMQRGVTPKADQTMIAMGKGKSCGACHEGKTAFASNTRCNACHVKEKTMKATDPHPHTAPASSH